MGRYQTPKIVFQTAMAISYELAPLQLYYQFPQIINGVNIFILGFLLLIIVTFLENETYRLQVSVCQHDYLRNSLPRNLKLKSILEGLVSN